MNNKMKLATIVVVFVTLIGGASLAYSFLGYKAGPGNNLSPFVTQDESEKIIAPDFTVFDAYNNEVKLSDFFGKPIVLNFWASWCPPCKNEMPDFNKTYEEMGDEITFVMVDLVDGIRETKEKGEKYITEQGFTFPVYYDINGEAGQVYRVFSIPTTIFIDRDGYISAVASGMIDEKTLREAAEGLK